MNPSKRTSVAALLIFVAALSMARSTPGRNVITVMNTNDSGQGSLRQAVLDAASSYYLVVFDPSLSGQVITLTSGEIAIGQGFQIDGSSLARSIVLNGNGASRIFDVTNTQQVVFTSLTFSNCNYTPGGAIYSGPGSDLIIENCTFLNNNAQEGGAILNDGLLFLIQCTFTRNSAAYGGGLQSRAATTVLQCTFSGNDAYYGGGGIYNKYPTLVIENSIIAGNTSVADPGQDILNQLGAVVYGGANIVEHTTSDRATAPDAGPAPLPVDPMLSPLGDDGGPMLTMQPLPGSPAIDAGAATLDEIQQVSVVQGPTSFELGFNGQNTLPMAGDATALDVQNALNALSTIAGLGGSVSVTLTSGVYTVTFGGNFSGENVSQLTPESLDAPVTVTTVIDGVPLPSTDQRGIGFPRIVGSAPDLGAVETQSAPAAGSYNGLFSEGSGTSIESSGSFSARVNRVSKNSVFEKFSAKLVLAGKTYSYQGQFDAFGEASNSLPRKGLSPLTVQLFAGLQNEVFGHISDGNWNADLTANRAVFDSKTNPAPQAGKYVMEIFGSSDALSSPAGFGIGAVTVASNGVVKVKGSLADGIPITLTSSLSQDGKWPIFVAANGGNETFLGSMGFDGNNPPNFYGSVAWIRKGMPKAKIYKSGFTNETAVSGIRYVPPLPGAQILGFTNCAIEFGDGSHVLETRYFTLDDHNKVAGPPDHKFALSFSPTTGMFSGKIGDPQTSTPVPLKGIILQKSGIGVGYALSTNVSSSIFLYQGP